MDFQIEIVPGQQSSIQPALFLTLKIWEKMKTLIIIENHHWQTI